MIKKNLSKIISVLLSLTIIISLVATVSYTAGAESTKSPAKLSDIKKTHDGELSKEETVYVIADAEGKAKKVIVSDWIKNPGSLEKIDDKSDLKDIENVKGDETYTMNSDNMCVWNADGNDIYYQGTSSSDLPVDVKVTYMLNGIKTSPKSIAGKSGKVTIRFDYNNKQYEKVKINGKEEKIYVPFVMLTGMLLDNDKFSNVEVNNGKVINDGSHTVVAGFALPGMVNNLDIDTDKFDVPEYVEITADVKDFELSTTMTLATNDVFSDIDFSKLDDAVDELDKKLDKLTDATDKLIDGSSQLYKGISTLLEKSDTLISGVKALADGAKQLADGADSLDGGVGQIADGAKDLSKGADKLDKAVGKLDIGVGELDKGAGKLDKGAGSLKSGAAQMRSGLSQLAEGLGQLSSNSDALTSGAEQVFNSLLKTADSQIAASGITAEKLTIDNYATVLDGIVKSLDKENVKKLAEKQALDTVTATVRSQESVIEAGVTAAVKAQVLEGVLAKAGMSMTAEEYAAAVEAGSIPAESQAQINAAVEQQMNTDGIKNTISENVESKIQSLIDVNMQSDEVQAQIQNAIDMASAGAEAIKNLKTQLDSFNTFYQGIFAYTDGVDTASNGAAELSTGSKKLKSGTDTLKKGTKDLKKGTSQLKDGTKQLKKGTSQLNAGAEKLAAGAEALKVGSEKLSGGAATLNAGTAKLNGGTGTLVSGVKQLKNGSMKLTNGLKQFKSEGVDALVKAVNGDAKTFVERLKAISKVSSNYKSFSGISDDMSGKVNFIYKTDSVDAK